MTSRRERAHAGSPDVRVHRNRWVACMSCAATLLILTSAWLLRAGTDGPVSLLIVTGGSGAPVGPNLVKADGRVWLHWLERLPVASLRDFIDEGCYLLCRAEISRRPLKTKGRQCIGAVSHGDGSLDVIAPRQKPLLVYTEFIGSEYRVSCAGDGAFSPTPESEFEVMSQSDFERLRIPATSHVWSGFGGPDPCQSRGPAHQVSVALDERTGGIAVSNTFLDCSWLSDGIVQDAHVGVWVRRSGDHGATWQPPEPLGEGMAQSLAFADSGDLVLVTTPPVEEGWSDYVGIPQDVDVYGLYGGFAAERPEMPGPLHLRVWRADSGEWTVPGHLFDTDRALEAALATDDEGDLWMAFTAALKRERRAPGRKLYLSRSPDDGVSWTSPHLAVSSAGGICQPDVCIVGDDVYLAYTRVVQARVNLCVHRLTMPHLGTAHVRPRYAVTPGGPHQ